jgi:hypothetical protein
MAAGLTATVVMTSVAIFLFASYTWLKGSAHVMAEADSELAIQAIDRQLRESLLIAVDANGNGLTYELPLHNPDGSYAVPEVWDNVTRRIALSGTSLVMTSSGGPTQVLARSIYPYDPLASGQTTYKIFTAPAGQKISFLTVMIVTSQLDGQQNLITSRSREAVYLRNLPQAAH